MPDVIKVSHGLTIGDLKYGNTRPGVVEATLKPGETMEEALDELDERLNAWHRKRYPHLYEEQQTEPTYNVAGRPPIIHQGPIPVISKDKDKVEIDIDNASSLKELGILKEAASKFGLISHYMKRVKELTK